MPPHANPRSTFGRLARRVALSAAAVALALALAHPAGAQIQQENLWVANGAVNAIAVSGGVLYLGGQFDKVGPAIGGWAGLDPTTGAVHTPYPLVDGSVFAAVSDGHGGWYLGGQFDAVLRQPRNNLAQIDSAGNLTAWNPNANGVVRALAVDGGTLYAGGDFTSMGAQVRHRLAALDAVTAAVGAWNPDADNSVFTILPWGGAILVGGQFNGIGGTFRANICGLDPVTGLANSWQPNADGAVRSLAVFAKQVFPFTVTIYAGGDFHSIGTMARNRIAALDPSTGGASSWDPNANGAVDVVRVSVSHNVPTVYLAGDFDHVGGILRTFAAGVDGNGLPTAFNPSVDGPIGALELGNGLVYVGGNFDIAGGQPRRNIAALDATGAATAWDPQAHQPVDCIGLVPGTVFIGGGFTSVGGVTRHNLAAFDLTTGAATSWIADTDGVIYSMAAVGGVVYVGGAISTVNGLSHTAVAAIGADGTVSAWNPGIGGMVLAIASRKINNLRNAVYLGGNFTAVAGGATPRHHLAAYDDLTGALSTWDPNAGDDVHALAVSGSTIYAGGNFTTMGASTRHYLAALDLSGAVTPWDPSPDGFVRALAPNGSNVYVGGITFANIGGQPRAGVAAIDATTGLATSWNPAPISPFVYSIAPSGSDVYVGGAFGTLGGSARASLGAVDATTGVATAWDPEARDPNLLAGVLSLSTDGQIVYAGGLFTNVLGLPRSGVAAITRSLVGVGDLGLAGVAQGLRAWPNPFHSDVAFRFGLLHAGPVDAGVYDVTGRRVRALYHGAMSAGEQRLAWDGRDDAGRAVRPAPYFVRVVDGARVLTGKVFRLR